MAGFLGVLENVNSELNNFIWGPVMLVFFILVGVLFTVRTGVFQVSKFGLWMKSTFLAIFKNKKVLRTDDKHAISQFQSLCTALAATVGTGNIVGVATAIALGGPGAVFWMWFSAFLGMMTNYAENTLGIKYRFRDEKGHWVGGAMHYMERGFKWKRVGKVFAVLFSIFCTLASFGIGNMSQGNSIASGIQGAFFPQYGAVEVTGENRASLVDNYFVETDVTDANREDLTNIRTVGRVTENEDGTQTTVWAEVGDNEFGYPSAFGINGSLLVKSIIAIIIMVFVALVIIGGIKRIASVTEKIVPFMVLLYLIGGLVIIFVHFDGIGRAFTLIFGEAFKMQSAAGGFVGYGIAMAMRRGISRGVFSNEAGLGSSVMVHSASDVKEPVIQGMWGIFEVFADTIIVCTITALSILTSGVYNLGEHLKTLAENGGSLPDAMTGAGLTQAAFSTVFGSIGAPFVSIAILLFAFSTILGWSYYGERSWTYLFGSKTTTIYKVIFIAVIYFGCTSGLSLVWDISDTFNGFMAVPNLIAVTLLSGQVVQMTRDYLAKRRGKLSGRA
ncbi:MAG: alanine:cation symporter family protein, partial [Oscillospiraceae bacterium]|nr:alanine:cation symporter family protein [Oscillospiraceae bacterium]